jgi:hypothetical protein
MARKTGLDAMIELLVVVRNIFIFLMTIILIYQFYRLNKASSENDDLKRDNKHLLEQVQKCNDEFERWNQSYMAQDYAKRNNIKPLKINE